MKADVPVSYMTRALLLYSVGIGATNLKYVLISREMSPAPKKHHNLSPFSHVCCFLPCFAIAK